MRWTTFFFLIVITAGFAGNASVGEPAVQIDRLSQITTQVGKYPNPLFLRSACLLAELRRILGPDYEAYFEHMSASGAGALTTEGNFVSGDISQLHVGGYSSLFFVDVKTEKIYLFWLKSSVRKKEYQLYGDRPIPAPILSSIERQMNEGWGHVARFRFVGEFLTIDYARARPIGTAN